MKFTVRIKSYKASSEEMLKLDEYLQSLNGTLKMNQKRDGELVYRDLTEAKMEDVVHDALVESGFKNLQVTITEGVSISIPLKQESRKRTLRARCI